jgi:flavin reductase (DIM6/NTAB) family NADH-FMN oxidoreductase RutF
VYYEIDSANPHAHGLPHNPFKSLIVPRPIGWISTIDAAGKVNLAPYSFFNGVADSPPMVMFAHNGRHREGGYKDSVINAETTGEFVVNVATWHLRAEMQATAAFVPRSVDEMELVGLRALPSVRVRPPRVALSPVHLECVYLRSVRLPADNLDEPNVTVFGRVVAIHIDDGILTDGLIDNAKLRPLARMGYQDYTVIDSVFPMKRQG